MKKLIPLALMIALSPLAARAEVSGVPTRDPARLHCDQLVKETVAVMAYARPGMEGKASKLSKMPIGIDRVTALPVDGKEGYQPAYVYSLNDCPSGDDSCNDEIGTFTAKVYVGGKACMLLSFERNVF